MGVFVYREWVDLTMVSGFYEYLNCTDSDVVLFLLLLTNVFIVLDRFG